MIQIKATDLDQPGSASADMRYSIVSQDPLLPSKEMFTINPVSGVIRVNARGLDREVRIKVQANLTKRKSLETATLQGVGHLFCLLWGRRGHFTEINPRTSAWCLENEIFLLFSPTGLY